MRGHRFEDLLYHATDRRPTPDLAQHAAGVAYLLHDASFDEEDFAGITDPEQLRKELWGHSTAQDSARLARNAGADRLKLIHLSPSFE